MANSVGRATLTILMYAGVLVFLMPYFFGKEVGATFGSWSQAH